MKTILVRKGSFKVKETSMFCCDTGPTLRS